VIDRYNVKDISKIWNEEEKFSNYLLVEKALLFSLKSEHPTEEVISKLENINISTDRIKEIEKIVKHDVIAFCTSITEQLTEEDARFFHWGVTSSDIIDTAHSLLIKKSLKVILDDYKNFLVQLYKKSRELRLVPCMGRSHGINAEPMSAGVKFLNHYTEHYRRYLELTEFYENEITAQFSGAVGNYTVITPEQEKKAAEYLGLKVEPVSSQVIGRDRISKLMGIISNYSVGLERLCIEIRHLHHSNINELAEGFGQGQKGSSTMPHKKNPISTENLTGISRMLRTYYSASLENNLLWHERDISHSSAERIFLPDTFGLLSYSLRRASRTVEDLVIFSENMLKNIPKNNYFFSSYVLHQLILKTKLRREEIYEKLQKISFESIENDKNFLDLVKKQFPELTESINLELPRQQLINENFLTHVDTIFDKVNETYPQISP